MAEAAVAIIRRSACGWDGRYIVNNVWCDQWDQGVINHLSRRTRRPLLKMLSPLEVVDIGQSIVTTYAIEKEDKDVNPSAPTQRRTWRAG